MPNRINLIQRVIDELQWDPRLRSADIGAAVDNGIVTLTGFVDTHAAKAAAVHITERVRGVRAVANELQIRHDPSYIRADTQLAAAVLHALTWDVTVPNERIRVRVENGWVILDGEVDWHFQRQAAEAAVRNLYGVKGVTNCLLLAPTMATSDEVQQRITEAIKRSAEDDARTITVDASEDKVTLRGTVHSWAEREQAERAAWNSKGVMVVDNQIGIVTK